MAGMTLPRTTYTVKEALRVFIDPNSVAPQNADWSVALFSDASRTPIEGERVTVVQDEEEGPDLIGTGTVTRVDAAHEVFYVQVDWRSFVEEAFGVPSRSTAGHASRDFLQGVRASFAEVEVRSGAANPVGELIAA